MGAYCRSGHASDARVEGMLRVPSRSTNIWVQCFLFADGAPDAAASVDLLISPLPAIIRVLRCRLCRLATGKADKLGSQPNKCNSDIRGSLTTPPAPLDGAPA